MQSSIWIASKEEAEVTKSDRTQTPEIAWREALSGHGNDSRAGHVAPKKWELDNIAYNARRILSFTTKVDRWTIKLSLLMTRE